MNIQQIADFLEKQAPAALQESYDNSGLLVGDPTAEVQGVLVALDATPEVLEEAKQKNCNLVVAHHPIVFNGLKRITGKNYIERVVIFAIRHNIAVYAIHTNLDSVMHGVNNRICDRLGLQKREILAPKEGWLSKITTFVPTASTPEVVAAMSKAGAGEIGNYSDCSFQLPGTGTFRPNQAANPYIGQANKTETVKETRVEMVLPSFKSQQVLAALKQAHPYEEVAFYLQKLDNPDQTVGAGMLGKLPEPLPATEFLSLLADSMQLKVIRHTALVAQTVSKVAVCGGSGSFLLGKAMAAGAQAFVTADFKYHQFFDAEDRLIIADIGHYESEAFTTDLLAQWLEQNFKVPVLRTGVNTNPVKYFCK